MTAIRTFQTVRERPIPRPALRLLFWILVLSLATLDAALISRYIVGPSGWVKVPFDWDTFQTAASRIGDGTLCSWTFHGSYEYSYRYSPLMLPLLAWLAWRRPRWRAPGLAVCAAVAGLTLLSGEASNFVAALGRSDDMFTYARNFGPTRWFGTGWLVVGIPLGVILTWRGRVGWASLAESPYLLPYHFLIAFLELVRTDARSIIGLLASGFEQR